MNQRNIFIALLGVIIIFVGVGYYAVFREPEAPSAPIEAIPLEPEPTAEEEVAEAPEATEVPTEAPEATEVPTEAPEATEVSTEAPEATEAPTEEAILEVEEEATKAAESTEVAVEEPANAATDEPEASHSEAIIFEIASDQSSSRFELDEDLRGERITVVGSSDQVAAQLRFNPADLSTAQVGTVLVNARAFMTDSEFRNRAIHNRILMTGEYEFITFEPTDLVGLPASAAVGETVNFEIIGNLTIRDITQEVTFATSVTAESEKSLRGSASTVIQGADYDLNIPEVPNVANVEEEVELYIDFVANAIDAPSEEAADETEETGAESQEGEAAEGEAEEPGEESTEESSEEATEEPTEEITEEAAAEPVAEEAVIENTKLNLNTVTADELLNTIPNFGNRMVREFFEYRPYISILQFRREIGKYVDEAQVAEYEQYVYVPINVDESDGETLKQIPGVDETIATELIAARPYGSNDAFLAKLGEYLSPAEVGRAAGYLGAE